MGGSVSAGVDNNDLVDNLLAEDCIKTPSVERVFRAVDRGMYFPPLSRDSAYKDLAWKSGNIHLSAPCIYCEVMENLNLAPGMSFLNLGSGTGYLSTMAGLILGPFGINHGIEIHQDVIQYAHDRLEEFKKTATAIEEYDFCEPKFVQGNCLQLDSYAMKYDRVYCGAACPPSYENYMKNLIKVGGILVIPLKDRLLRIRRVSEKVWDTRSVLPVAFANLIEPSTSCVMILPTVEPISLMDTCRTAIRGILKAAVDVENPELKVQSQPKSKSKKRTLQHLFVPMFLAGEPERVTVITNLQHRNRGVEVDSDDNSANSSRGELSNSDGASSDRPSGDDAVVSSPTTSSVEFTPERFHLREDALSSDADSDAPSDSSSSNSLTNIYQVQQALFHAMTSMRTLNSTSSDPLQNSVPPSVFPPISTLSKLAAPNNHVASSDSSALHDDSSDSSMDVDHPGQNRSKAESSKSKGKCVEGATTKRSRSKRKEAEMENDDPTQSSNCVQTSPEAVSSMSVELNESEQTRSSKKKSGAKREKVDSGIGEDIGALGSWDMSPSDLGSELDLGSDSDSDEEGMYNSETQSVRRLRNGNFGAWKERKGVPPAQECRQQEANAYIVCMRSKIQLLPLPHSIKSYINFHRDL